ncbi:MAG: hypothetical protein J6U27_00820, partial [Spirochaetales bacterium]|nr:hypothetical protein [Spirochaetales bacterium]
MEKNLRDRLITVFLGVPVVLGMIFFVPQYNFIAFSIFILAMTFVGSLEMSKMLFGKVTPIGYLSFILPMVQYLQGIMNFNSQIPDLVYVALLLLSFMIEIKAGEKDNFKQSLERAGKNALLITYPGYL